MGLLKGSASFVRFSVEGEQPDNFWDFAAERIAAFSFRDIDDSYDEYSIGWVSILNMFDSEFQFASYAAGDFITLSLRMDERKVPAAVIKKFVEKEVERIKREKELPKLPRSQRIAIKERVESELMRKALPVPSVYDLCWNLADSTLLFFSTNQRAQTLLEDLFKETFGLTIMQQIPYNVAERMLPEESVADLATIGPDIFV